MTQNQFNKCFPQFIDELKETGDPRLALALSGITELDLKFYIEKANQPDPEDPTKIINTLKAEVLRARAFAIKYLLGQIKFQSNNDYKAAVEYLKLLGFNKDKEEEVKPVQIIINSPQTKVEQIEEIKQIV